MKQTTFFLQRSLSVLLLRLESLNVLLSTMDGVVCYTDLVLDQRLQGTREMMSGSLVMFPSSAILSNLTSEVGSQDWLCLPTL